MNRLHSLMSLVLARRQEPAPNSYTNYLFDQGLDKILKKVGEEATETVIAAKNGDADELAQEMADLLYHLTVLLADQGMDWEAVGHVLDQRAEKTGNKKPTHRSDPLS